MSVNITVNGKFGKECRSHPLLMDPQEARKAEEKEKRIVRLLEVRDQSKKLAKKIRDEVNEEKRKELQQLQAAKERELECWRKHALQREGEMYREAIFQIGTAHRNAKNENENRAAKQKPQQTYKDFKKQMAAKKCQPGKIQFSCQALCPCQQTVTGDKKQLKCTCTQTEEPNNKTNRDKVNKRKRDLSISSSELECEDEGYKEQTALPQSSSSWSSSCDSTTSIFNNDQATQTSMFVPTKSKGLIKTPAVYLDVEVGTDDSITISAPAEVVDKHIRNNRKFCSVIRVSPRKGRKQIENTCEYPLTQQSSTTTTIMSDVAYKGQNGNKLSSEKSQNNQHNNAPVTKEKRYTIISDLVKKQKENEPNHLATTNYISTSATVTPRLSPKKQLKETAARPSVRQSPRKVSATSKSSRTENIQPTTSLIATAKSNTATVNSGSSSSGRVQFFDYNSKLSKEREQAATSISVQRQKDTSQPSAMEQAELEKQKERERQLDALKKRQQMEERGQKAMEREQIRRDCLELTEKLEALTREYPNQVPTNETQPHIFADKQLRKESKMNSAIEKLLQRPTIITCSELNKENKLEVQSKPSGALLNLGNELNVADLYNKPLPADDVSSDSCCSILLGYVDNQSRLVKQDIQNNNNTQNQSKQKRLENLLKRLDDLRNCLLEELKNESKSKTQPDQKQNSKFLTKEENLKQTIDNISQMRKEREQIMLNDNSSESKPLKKREKELQAKEALLEQKVREFYELQKQQNKQAKTKKDSNSNSKQGTEESLTSLSSNEKIENIKNDNTERKNVVCSTKDNPLEIIITVKGETKSVKIPQKNRKKIVKKSPTKLSTLIKSSQSKPSFAKKQTPKKKPQNSNSVGRHNSYDSNSTSYMSLPPELPTKIDDLAELILQERRHSTNNQNLAKEAEINNQITSTQDQLPISEISLEPLDNTTRFNPPPHINPLIAQYVQRLLGMSRNAIQKLQVSSSEIETPGSSIINTTSTTSNSDTIISDQRLIDLQSFVEENKSFIKDLEESIRCQNNVSLENSMRLFDDIWRQRFRKKKEDTKNKNTATNNQTTEKAVNNKNEPKSSLKSKEKKSSKNNNIIEQTTKTIPIKSKEIEHKTSTENVFKDLSKTVSSHYSTDDKDSYKSLKINKRTVDKAVNAKLSSDSSRTQSDSQIARYAKLTENCTHRIAELTELINRVREEKQRLLEVTLSSVSDNGRQSTEYLELPEGKSIARNESDDLTRVSSSCEEMSQNKNLQSTDEMPKLTLADKNKQIAISHDSGIAESRPMTALENRIDPEPHSQTSSESAMPQPLRKMKPPPTIKRYSPQLPEDELVHELSTILEVDTPVTSRINTAVGQSAEERENVLDNRLQEPIKFPTFEEYIKQLELDITQLESEQSIQLQQEFATFLECLQRNRSPREPSQRPEFPSINAYLERLAEADSQFGAILEESLAQLHLRGIIPGTFPGLREYIKHNTSKSSPSEDQQLLDTKSLENITDEPAYTDDTASLDIEQELKNRKILKNPFRVIKTKEKQILSSSSRRDAIFYKDILAAESGVDKLSTSDNTSDSFNADLNRVAQQKPVDVRKKSKETKVLSSTSTSTNVSALANSALKAASLDESLKGSGRPLNLRDFLTRELEKKLDNNSNSTSTADESLRSYFLHSLIGSLTPRTTGAGSKSGAQTLERQKTSTPVPNQSSQANSTASNHSNSSSQLFSGESRLSSVHYHDRSVRFFTSDGANADQSSE